MAKDKTPKADKPKKQRWYSYLGEAYKISKEAYSWTPLAVFGPLLLGIALGIGIGAATGRWIIWPLTLTLLGVVVSMWVLVQLVKRASYAKIDGMPGATAAVLDQIRRGWIISTEPVRFNARTQDMVFRAIGRPGVVLLTDGNPGRTAKLVEEERRYLKRVIPSVPVNVISVGNGDGQVPLIKVQNVLKKLPKKITNQEVNAVAKRIEAVKVNSMPIPKGIDPMKARPDRKGMRGR